MNQKIPSCRGSFEPGDDNCDGMPHGPTPEDRAPCAFRDRCRGLQIYVGRIAEDVTDEAVDRVLDPLSDEELIGTADMIVVEVGIEDGRLPTERATVRPRNGKARRRRRKTKNAPYPEELLALYQHARRSLRRCFNEWRFAEGAQLIAGPGTIYEHNRAAGSDYVTFYCTSEVGPPHALICLRFKPGACAVHVELPVQPETLQAVMRPQDFRKLSVEEYSRGQFRSIVRDVSDDKTIGQLVEALRKMVDKGFVAVSYA